MIVDAYKEKEANFLKLVERVSGHNVHTPLILAEEIVTKIKLKKKSTIAILFNIEFVFTLIHVYGVDANDITFFGDCKIKKQLVEKYGCKYIDTSVLSNEEKFNMKFDVVLANPPYDGEMDGVDQTKKIWISFAHKCLDLVKTNGYLGFVSPPSWVLSNDAKLKKVRNRILDFDLQYLRLGVQEQFPSKPGVQIGYFVLQKIPYKGNTKFIDEGTTISKTIDLRNGLPLSSEEQYKQNLINKISDSSPTKYNFILNDKKDKDLSSPGTLKVIVNYSKAYYSLANTVDHNMPITTDPINHLQGYISVKTISEGKKHKSFLHSKPIIWFANNYKRRGQTGFCDAVKRSAIPQFQTKDWTDAEVYKVLNLTKEEINYIEANN